MKKKRARSRTVKEIPSDQRQEPVWTVYIIECSDGTFYTGITNKLARRLDQHNAGRASRYTRSRRPVRVIYQDACVSRSEASIREGALKALSRKEKEKLILKRRIDVTFCPID